MIRLPDDFSVLPYLSIGYTFLMTCDCVIGFWKANKYARLEKALKVSRLPSFMVRFVCIFLFVVLTAAFHKFRFTPDLGNVNIFATVVLCGTAFYTRLHEKSLATLTVKKIHEDKNKN